MASDEEYDFGGPARPPESQGPDQPCGWSAVEEVGS